MIGDIDSITAGEYIWGEETKSQLRDYNLRDIGI